MSIQFSLFSFIVGFLGSFFLFSILNWWSDFKKELFDPEDDDTVEERTAMLTRLTDTKIGVFDENTGEYLFRFSGWENLKKDLIEVDSTVTWHVQYTDDMVNDNE